MLAIEGVVNPPFNVADPIPSIYGKPPISAPPLPRPPQKPKGTEIEGGAWGYPNDGYVIPPSTIQAPNTPPPTRIWSYGRPFNMDYDTTPIKPPYTTRPYGGDYDITPLLDNPYTKGTKEYWNWERQHGYPNSSNPQI